MSFLQRIKRLVGAQLDDGSSPSDDPAARVRVMIIELRTHVSESRAALALAVRDERRLERQIVDAAREVDRWQLNARHALEARRDDLAREALKRKLGAQKFIEELTTEHQKLQQGVQTLKHYVVELERRLREAQSRERLLLQKQRRLKQAEFLKERFPERKHDILKAALEELSDDTERLTYDTLLLEEDPLETRFRELEHRDDLVADELADLKKNLQDEAAAEEEK